MDDSVVTNKNANNKNTKRRGPPNRMNDLDYSTWMKFQKSFFPWKSLKDFAFECIRFFTKAKWENGESGKVLLIGDKELKELVRTIEKPRIVDYIAAKSHENILKILEEQNSSSYHFILISLLNSTDRFDTHESIRLSKNICSHLARILTYEKYASVILPTNTFENSVIPYPWIWATYARGKIRLRDEKLGLRKQFEDPIYCMFFQSLKDNDFNIHFNYDSFQFYRNNYSFPKWIIPKPPPRKAGEMLHPAKFPETLIEQFITIFSNEGDLIFDPMAGTGSTLVAAREEGRNSIGIELIPEFVEIANNRLKSYTPSLFDQLKELQARIIVGNALYLKQIDELNNLQVDYCVTSPPYWSMLKNPGSENQRARRGKGLKTFYSENDDDVGNIQNYNEFLETLVKVYDQVAHFLKPKGILTIIVKNVKRNHFVYSLAWDLVFSLCKPNKQLKFIGNTFWCQDDVGLKPFAVGTHWVSNTLHHYCLHFIKLD